MEIIKITIDDALYPEKLKSIDNPPQVLYAKGDVSLLNEEKHSAVIGARDVSMKGMDVAIGLSNTLSMNGEVVVSGLARGCDTGAHLGALGAGGRTIAILPSPVDEVYPPENQGLADRIVESGGLLISEYPTGTAVEEENFIARDRLQAAMSEGLIVVESHVGGGTMETVSFAEEMGKMVGVYRHPGGFDMTTTTDGNEYLIKEKKMRAISNFNHVNEFIKDMNDIRRDK